MAIEPTIGEIFQFDAGPVTALTTAQSVRVPEPGRRANKWLLLWMIPAAIPVIVIALANSGPSETPEAKKARLAVVKQKCGVENSGYWDNERQDCMCRYECLQASKAYRNMVDETVKMYSWGR